MLVGLKNRGLSAHTLTSNPSGTNKRGGSSCWLRVLQENNPTNKILQQTNHFTIF
ncbi:hypothetical protein ADICYQ_1446 [Cyclobacterium qasimii M12-11B]|uniref:Uncharacterized protein n=1 Tax=Cyclobacterium qasimii M12-11B TaxID=641524 RepID=S7VI65_9BACT|nr:hypothetical protein ADICYQ_1446 [Cyclobacterium qasimii M12-11B]